MAQTAYTIASSALVMIGANPVSSFKSTGSVETIACYYTWQPCIDHWLSLYPWRFATTTTVLSRITRAAAGGNPGKYDSIYAAPSSVKAIQAIEINNRVVEYDREKNEIYLDNPFPAGPKPIIPVVWCRHTYQPSITIWPGYFVALIEAAMAHRLSFALSGKLDLKKDLEADIETLFRLGRNADSRQQTTRKFRLTGRNSIMEARRA